MSMLILGAMLGSAVGAYVAACILNCRGDRDSAEAYERGYRDGCQKTGEEMLRRDAEHFETMQDKDDTIHFYRDMVFNRKTTRELMQP